MNLGNRSATSTKVADVLARIADTPITRLEQLLPWNWVVVSRSRGCVGSIDGSRNRAQSGNNRALVCEALLHDWDPTGISDIPEAKDEYDAYADVVLGKLVNEHATAEDIAEYLFEIATEHMALTDRGMAELCDSAAKAIVALRSDF